MADGKSGIGFPPDFQYVGIEEWKGLNTKPKRAAIDDQQAYWLENIMPIGAANARAVYGKGATLYTAPGGKTIVFYQFYNIGSTDYCGVFLSDGTAYQIKLSDSSSTTISSTASTFYNSGDLPALVQYGNKGILIVSTAQTNGYWAWDGTTLTAPGSGGPSWATGLDAPITLVGNENSSTTLSGFANTVGVVVGMWVTGSGIPANTFVTGGTSTTITISNAATATSSGVTFTFNWQWPTGINGTSIDTYQNRVFIVSGTKRLMSGASNAANFSANNDGVIATSYDSTLRKGYSRVLSSSGYVYLFGDSSIWNIASVTSSTNSSTNITTATYQYSNTDPQTGTSYVNSVQVLGRVIAFANTNGVYALTGNTAVKISDPLDGIWATLDTSVKPTTAVATLYGIRVLIVCIRAKDYLNQTRNFMCAYDPGKREWFVASQEIAPTFIATLEVNSNLTAYGSDGNVIFPMFQTPSASITKTVQSKLYPGGQSSIYIIYKQILRFYLEIDPLGASPTTFSATADTEGSQVPIQLNLSTNFTFVNNSGGTLQFSNNSSQNLYWSILNGITATDAQNTGQLIGFTLTSTGTDFVIERIGLGFRNETALY